MSFVMYQLPELKNRPILSHFGIVLSFVIFTALVFASPASADDWGSQSSDTGAHPDGSTHNYCWGGGFDTNLRDNVDNMFAEALDGPTDATAEFKSTCKFSGSGETDVVWFDEDLPGRIRGKVVCEDYDGDYCDQFYATLDPAEINMGSNDEADTDKTVCHELGHTLGLTHGPGGGDGGADDCMISGERPNTHIKYELFSTHHKEHINDWF